ncbi:ABC transporter substrate-binding protein [Enterococcus massiliensis]|uniref:ABC transporter substrate-binding protein n=1 Tax=Enterococcus massiliensis TaxID=1640685 RepID=UPI00065E4026|nr:sugar ABC transporter substrate-binding protein [Enterococcus massiliensis]
MKLFKCTTLGLLAISLLGITGCGSTTNGKNGSGSGNVNLKLSLWETYEAPGMKEIAKAFEKENPNVNIEVEVTPWDQYWTKMEAASTGGTAPDIITMHSNESYRYMSNGALLKLDDLIEDEIIDMSNYKSGIDKLYQYEDSQYAIPKDVSTVALWYNKTLFDEAGIPYPDETWTWDIFLDAAKKLTNQEKGIYGFAASNNSQDGYNNFIFQNNGTKLTENRNESTFNTPNTVDAMQWYIDLILKEKVSPTNSQLDENDPAAMFQSGRVAMITHGSWMANQFQNNDYTRDNCDVAVLPKGKVRATQMNGLGYSISATTKYPKEAKKFLTFLASKEGNKIQADNGTAIPAYNGLAGEWVKSFPEFNAQAFVDEIDYGVLRPFNNSTIKWETFETETLRDAFSGKTSVKDIAAKIQDGTNEIIKEAE